MAIKKPGMIFSPKGSCTSVKRDGTDEVFTYIITPTTSATGESICIKVYRSGESNSLISNPLPKQINPILPYRFVFNDTLFLDNHNVSFKQQELSGDLIYNYPITMDSRNVITNRPAFGNMVQMNFTENSLLAVRDAYKSKSIAQQSITTGIIDSLKSSVTQASILSIPSINGGIVTDYDDLFLLVTTRLDIVYKTYGNTYSGGVFDNVHMWYAVPYLLHFRVNREDIRTAAAPITLLPTSWSYAIGKQVLDGNAEFIQHKITDSVNSTFETKNWNHNVIPQSRRTSSPYQYVPVPFGTLADLVYDHDTNTIYTVVSYGAGGPSKKNVLTCSKFSMLSFTSGFIQATSAVKVNVDRDVLVSSLSADYLDGNIYISEHMYQKTKLFIVQASDLAISPKKLTITCDASYIKSNTTTMYLYVGSGNNHSLFSIDPVASIGTWTNATITYDALGSYNTTKLSTFTGDLFYPQCLCLFGGITVFQNKSYTPIVNVDDIPGGVSGEKIGPSCQDLSLLEFPETSYLNGSKLTLTFLNRRNNFIDIYKVSDTERLRYNYNLSVPSSTLQSQVSDLNRVSSWITVVGSTSNFLLDRFADIKLNANDIVESILYYSYNFSFGPSGVAYFWNNPNFTDDRVNGIDLTIRVPNCSGIFKSVTGISSWNDRIGGTSQKGVLLDSTRSPLDLSVIYDGVKDVFLASTGTSAYWATLVAPSYNLTLKYLGQNILASTRGITFSDYTIDGITNLDISCYLNLDDIMVDEKTYQDQGFAMSGVIYNLKVNSAVSIEGTGVVDIVPPQPTASISLSGLYKTIAPLAYGYINKSADTAIKNVETRNISEETIGTYSDSQLGVTTTDIYKPFPIYTSNLSKGDRFYISYRTLYKDSKEAVPTPKTTVATYCYGSKFKIDACELFINGTNITNLIATQSPYIYRGLGAASVTVSGNLTISAEGYDSVSPLWTPYYNDHRDYPCISGVYMFMSTPIRTRSTSSYLEYRSSDIPATYKYPNCSHTYASYLKETYYNTTSLKDSYMPPSILPVYTLNTNLSIICDTSNEYELYAIIEDEFGFMSAFCLSNQPSLEIPFDN